MAWGWSLAGDGFTEPGRFLRKIQRRDSAETPQVVVTVLPGAFHACEERTGPGGEVKVMEAA